MSKEDCKFQLSQLLAHEQVCDPLLFDDFEAKVNTWKSLCAKHIEEAEHKEVEANVANFRACSERERAIAKKRDACKSKISALQANVDCEGKRCKERLAEVDAVMGECADVQLGGPSLDLANNLAKEYRRRIESEEKLESALVGLKDDCPRIRSIAEEGEIDQAIDLLVTRLKDTAVLETVPPQGSATEQLKKETLAACGAVVKATADTFAVFTEGSLKKSKGETGPWLARYNRLEAVAKSLSDSAAGNLFPGAIDAVGDLVASLQKEKDKNEAREAKAREAGIKKALSKGARTCKKLIKTISRYKDKVASYAEKKGKEKKVAAYEAKLDKAQRALDALNRDIAEGLASGTLPEARAAKVVKALEASGCPVSAAPSAPARAPAAEEEEDEDPLE